MISAGSGWKRTSRRHTGADRDREVHIGHRLDILLLDDRGDLGALLGGQLGARAGLTGGRGRLGLRRCRLGVGTFDLESVDLESAFMSLPAFPLSRVESVVRLSSRCILSSDCVDFTAGFCSDLLVVSVASSLLTGALRSAGAARSAAAPPAGALVAPLRAAPPAGASRVIPAPPAPPPDVAAPAPPGFCALSQTRTCNQCSGGDAHQ